MAFVCKNLPTLCLNIMTMDMAAAAPINTVAHLALAYRSVPLISLMPAVRSCMQTSRCSLCNPQPRSKPAPLAPSTITADCCSDDLPQKIAQI
ncbi:hypothetical protein F5141DRAFT_482438 [Pisolithus sp. B1]|nr:hypothetical protein F5141DRAFT_482438 [Pisolithus sp. B1]